MKNEKENAPSNSIIERIYEYDNYRMFLKDFFIEQKRLRAIFSHRYFAKKAGFASSSYFAHLVDGKRNVTIASLEKLIFGLGLKSKHAEYFSCLVNYNQAKSLAERELYHRQLVQIRKSSKIYKIKRRQWAIFDEWYLPVLRELAVYANWNGRFDILGKMVQPPIHASKAEKGITALLESGLLVKEKNGIYKQPEKAVSAEGVPGSVLRKAKRELIARALDAADNLPVNQRHISSATVAMSRKSYQQIVDMIDKMRKRIMDIAVQDTDVDEVYQFNFQVFPFSKSIKGKKRK